ncbi:hypothetical protein JK628_22470 [Shewanella sp. KX20019]|uniref:hypothetical protein n=1 Tax=Shewanella sp. KX20019 TaxID=2803864 RepID=UPI001926BB23|nr:hypothetical protein [Shewanella sp. KX20019]QQX80197.1 hypothetical protein JK628_22470 [Shewanella sp. KX20019]
MDEDLELDFSEFEYLFNKESDLFKFGGILRAEINISEKKVRNKRVEIDVRKNQTGTKNKRAYSLSSHPREKTSFEKKACLLIDTNKSNDSWLTTALYITEQDGFMNHELFVHLWDDNRTKTQFKELNICKEVVGIYLELSFLINVFGIENTLIRVLNDANLAQQDLVREFLMTTISKQERGLRGNDFDICYINDRNKSRHKANALFYRIDELHRKIKSGAVTDMREAVAWVLSKDISELQDLNPKLLEDIRVIPVNDVLMHA